VVNFDLGERFPSPRSQQRGSLRPHARRVAVLGVVAGGSRFLPLRGSEGVIPGNFFDIFDAKSRVCGQFWPENKLIEGQTNEYNVICKLLFRRTIFYISLLYTLSWTMFIVYCILRLVSGLWPFVA